MTTLVEKIEKAIEEIINGYPSQYIQCYNQDDEVVRIRISDHKSNPQRMGNLDISLVIILPEFESDYDQHESICINKKKFNNIPNQYFLDENGNFTENFETIEELLDWYDINY